MRLHVLITAAGRSRRMGANKLMLSLDGVPVLVRTALAFQNSPRVDTIAVSAPPEQVDEYRSLLTSHGLEKLQLVAPGGAERQDSIRLTLEAMAADCDDLVMIHDGARPRVTQSLLDRLLAGLAGADGALPMLAVKDTIKRVDAGGRVLETLTRSELFAAQTPQLFRYATILEAHRKAHQAGFLGTDDASLVEWTGGRVVAVEGDPANLKLTTPEDLDILRAVVGS